MFDNLTKEIFYYSLIPAGVIAIIVLILLFISKKNENVYYKYNYYIKTALLIIIGLVLPLIIGYTIWVFERFINKNLVSSNLIYMILLVALIISLIVFLIVICHKLIKGINKSNEVVSE